VAVHPTTSSESPGGIRGTPDPLPEEGVLLLLNGSQNSIGGRILPANQTGRGRIVGRTACQVRGRSLNKAGEEVTR